MTDPTELAMTLARSALEEQAARIAELEEALRNLLWYAGQLEMLVYSSDDKGEHEEMAKARSVLQKEKTRA